MNDLPRTSVVILSFKKFEHTTRACFLSLAKDPKFAEWDVIIVDNDSGNETTQALKALQLEFPGLRLVLNQTNLGFAGGMNIGIREANGDIVCLLNSDIVVGDSAIGNMTNALCKDKKLGMVGPVTNAAGNEQKICVSEGGSVETILSEGMDFANSGPANRILAYRLDFCAVALKRQVFEGVGGLDEGFGRGYYEDFDYSLRAKKAGFDLGVAEDAFVYHQGSASFGSVDKETRTLISRNKRRVIQMHGADTLFPHVRDANLSVLEQYADQIIEGRLPPEQRVRNRLALAGTELPRSFFKRWKYSRKLKAVSCRLESDNESGSTRLDHG